MNGFRQLLFVPFEPGHDFLDLNLALVQLLLSSPQRLHLRLTLIDLLLHPAFQLILHGTDERCTNVFLCDGSGALVVWVEKHAITDQFFDYLY